MNQINSKILAVIGIVVFLALQWVANHFGVALFDNKTFLIGDLILAALTLAFAVINFKNTFETNDPWKSWGGWLTVLASAAWVGIFVSSQFN